MTDQAGAAPSQRPPKPVPASSRGRAASYDHTVRSSIESNGGASSDSREVLRKKLQKCRQLLTPQEHGFLEELIVKGDEIEVAMAHETLCDDDLFFETDNSGWGSDISLGSEHAISLPGITFEGGLLVEQAGDKHRTTETLGSEERQEHLNRRKESQLFAILWKSHEHGFSVKTPTRQRRKSISSLREAHKMVRKSSLLSAETEDLLKHGGPLERDGEDAVFRRRAEDEVFRSDPIRKDQQKSTGRRVSWRPGPKKILRRKSVSFSSEDQHTPLLVPLRVIRKRNVSADTQVSELGTDLDEPSSFTAMKPPAPIRSDSLSSFPSLHHAHHVHSDSGVSTSSPRSDSVTSNPSLHHGHPLRWDSGIRADSFVSESSVPSLHSGHPLQDKVAPLCVSSVPSLHHEHPLQDRFASTPFDLFSSEGSFASILSLHHGHPIRSDSVFSASSIPSLHHGHPIHSDSVVSASSIPSLHHEHPIRSNSVVSLLSSTSPPNDESREPAWKTPLPSKTGEKPDKQQFLRHPSQAPQRPVLLRRASMNNYNGEGIEVTELDDSDNPEVEIDSVDKARKYKSILSASSLNGTSLPFSNSFDETVRRESIFRDIRRSLSDEERSDLFLGGSRNILRESSKSANILRSDASSSWDMEEESPRGHYDAWNALDEDPDDGYGGGLPFVILGTCANDENATPHVLSPPLMESLQYFFPYSLTESNFWMKYSLLRDGASMHSLLQKIRGATHTIIAVETVDGEVFGSFQSAPWRKQWKYFGSGESFLWRMRKSRKTACHSVIDQAHMESELDVYPWSGENNCVQLCTHEKIAVGGGEPKEEKKADGPDAPVYGFGLAIENDLLYGTSSHCATFSSPPLSLKHSDGSPFEIVNLEVWSLTPCMTLEEAEKLELGQLFLRTN